MSKWKDGDGSLIEHLLPGDTLEMRSLGVHNAHMLSGLIADVRLGGGVVSCTATPWHATRTGNTFGIFADAQHGPVRVVEPHKHGHTGAQMVEARGHGASAEIAAYIFSDCGLLFTMGCHINSLEVTVIQPKQTLASLPRDDATFDGCPPQTATAPASIRAEEAGLASPASVEAVGGRPSAPAAALVDNDAAAEDVDTLLRPGEHLMERAFWRPQCCPTADAGTADMEYHGTQTQQAGIPDHGRHEWVCMACNQTWAAPCE